MRKILYFTLAVILTAGLAACSGNKTEKDQKAKPTAETVQQVLATEPAPAKSGEPIHLTKAEFLQKVVNYEANPSSWKYVGDKPCIIDFWATWCPPCKVIAPILDDLAKEYEGQIYVYKVDVDQEKELAQAFGIQSIPTLLFVPLQGEPKAEVGAISKEVFKERIDNFMLAKK